MLGTLHLLACWVLVLGNGLAGLWALAASRVLRLQISLLWWFTGFVQLWVFVQLTLAALHLNANEGTPETFHVFYGVLSAVTVAILYSYKGQLNRHQNALYGWGGLFIMGLGIRALLLL
tara:strand:+ start:242 stop:598 length:357 start_codon:yes stop_codon:yes gene_type:complete